MGLIPSYSVPLALVVGGLFVALIGHAAIWIDAVNRAHSTAMPHGLVRVLTAVGYGLLLALPATASVWWWIHPESLAEPSVWPLPLFYYAVVALLVGLVPVPWLIIGRCVARRPAILLHTTSQSFDYRALAVAGTSGWARRLISLPFNQAGCLEVNEKLLLVRRLPAELDGLVIAHLSDLHFTGRVARGFYREVVRHANAMQADLVLLTGDVVEKNGCLPWVAELLGELTPRLGRYYILGNHDQRIRLEDVRTALAQAGLKNLGAQSHELTVRGWPVLLAGNELPWIPPAAMLRDYPRLKDGLRPLRILLSHSPDQFRWAQDHDIDLMLAGHTHGGQIQVPVLGPIVAPSLYGVRYASGTFDLPPLAMHVSRGVSSELPLRIRCLPEITRLVLRSPVALGAEPG